PGIIQVRPLWDFRCGYWSLLPLLLALPGRSLLHFGLGLLLLGLHRLNDESPLHLTDQRPHASLLGLLFGHHAERTRPAFIIGPLSQLPSLPAQERRPIVPSLDDRDRRGELERFQNLHCRDSRILVIARPAGTPVVTVVHRISKNPS